MTTAGEPTAEPPPGALRSWRAPLLLSAVGCAALLALGLAWSLASPIGSSPDDPFHLATIWCDSGEPGFCRAAAGEGAEGTRLVLVPPEIGAGIACYAFRPTVSARCQADLESRVGLARGVANDGLYPGGFHRFMSLFATEHVGRSVVVMRMLSWMVAIGLVLAAWALAASDLRRSFSIALLTTLVPLGVFLFASTNPSGVAVAGVAAFWCAAQGYLSADGRGRRRTVLVVALMVAGSLVAVGSRFDAGLYLAVAGVAALIAAGGYRPVLRRRSLLVVAICLVGALGAVLGGQTQESLAGELGGESRRALPVVLFENALELPRLVVGSLGTFGLGWLDTPVPGLASTFMLLALGGVLLVGVSVASRDKWLALAVVAVALLLAPTLVLAANRNFVGENVQPRYLLPLLPVLVGTVLLAPRGRPGVVLRRGQVVIVVVGIVLAHSASLHANIRRYVTGVDVRGFDLGAQDEWWWGTGPGPLETWLLGSVAFAVVATCGLLLARGDPTGAAREGYERTSGGAP